MEWTICILSLLHDQVPKPVGWLQQIIIEITKYFEDTLGSGSRFATPKTEISVKRQ